MKLRQALPLLFLALLLTAGTGLLAQDRSPANDSSDGGRVAEPRSEPDPAPAEAPPEVSAPPDSSSDTSSNSSTDVPPDPPSGDTSEGSSQDSDRRYAVPVDTPVEPHRQPPSRDRHRPPSSGGGDDGGYVPEDPPIEVEADEPYDSYDTSSSGGRDALGALDLDVSPGRTQVYLNGQYVGIVDQYDGWPSHLWLEEGAYEIVFYLDGYRTLARQVIIHLGMVIKIDDRLVPGPSIPPEEFFRP